MGQHSFFGYRRENGRVGIRNHMIILPLDDLSNASAEAVANNIKGTLALPHAYGRLQFGEDLELHFRTLIGTGSNPNVAACVIRSTGSKSITEREVCGAGTVESAHADRRCRRDLDGETLFEMNGVDASPKSRYERFHRKECVSARAVEPSRLRLCLP